MVVKRLDVLVPSGAASWCAKNLGCVRFVGRFHMFWGDEFVWVELLFFIILYCELGC